MKKTKKLIALLLVLCMTIGCLTNVYAAESTETSNDTESISEVPENTEEINEDVSDEDAVVEDAADSDNEVSQDQQVQKADDQEEATTEEEDPAMLASTMTSVTKNTSVSLNTSTFYRIFHLDCGRKYFSVSQIEAIIDTLAANGYTHMELALGNDALRFILDDMEVSANNTTYSSTDVTNGIVAGNNNYYNDPTGNYLTESDMDSIIAYAGSKGIGIIPLINTPGHMDSIIDCMESLGISSPAYNNSARTIDVTNAKAVNFTLALVENYITYFADKGCTIFNMGCDEYANDIYSTGSMGFGNLISSGNYSSYITYVNNMAAQVQNAGMVAMAFNDGFYFNNTTSSGTFDTNIAIAYWTCGWGSYSVRSAANLASDGFTIINTNDAWYYVMGRSSGTYALSGAQTNVSGTKCTKVTGDNASAVTPAGCMNCVWCDDFASYTETEVSNVTNLITTFASSNSDKFVKPTKDATVSDKTTGITVTGENLTALTVEKLDTAFYSETGKKVIGYDITPAGYTSGNATVTIPVPDGWSGSISVYDVKNAATITPTVADGKITFTATHFSEYDLVGDDGSDPAYTSEKDITVNVGSTTTETVTGANYAGNYNTDDKTVATVKVTGSDATAATVSYDTASNVYPDGLATSTSWKKTSYYYKVSDGEYYPVYAYYKTSGGWWSSTTTYYWGYSKTDSSGDVTNISSTTSSYDTVSGLCTKTGTDAKEASTTITFTGMATGSTSVIIGGVKYNISVIDAPPSDAMTGISLTLEYWITNEKVYTSTSKTTSTATISSSAAKSTEGVAITDYAPSQAYSFFDGTVTVYYWQSMRLDSDNQQTSTSGDDETTDGTTFTRVRYYNNAWQYMTTDNVWHYFLSDDQAVAYYLQKTSVTKEVDTYMKDWGYSGTSGSSSDTSSGAGQVDLSVAVVYPDGTVSPSEDNIFPNSSVIFNYWSGRDIGIVAPVNNSDYDISKITYTYGTRTDSTTSSTWNFGTSKISWNKTTTAAGTEWYDETTVWDDSMTTTPVVNGKASSITWKAKNTGILILIYLKPVHKDTNLTVKWVDDTADATITSQEVVVDSTTTTTTFLNGLKNSSGTVIGANGPWDTKSNVLPDDAYITNTSGVNQTFNKDLTKMQNIPGQYTTGLYSYTGAEVSEDGMTLTLHYSMTGTTSYNYIVDFGMPVTVSLTDLGITSTTNISSVTTTSNAAYDASAKTITYTPSKVLTGTEAVTARVNYTSGYPTTITIGFMPATSVYYEESFVSYEPTWSIAGKSNGGTQTASKAQTSQQSKAAVYGYDATYANESAGATNGTYLTTDTRGAKASFTFKGTGIEIYNDAKASTGNATVVIQDSTGNVVKMAVVNTVSTSSIYSGISDTDEYGLSMFSITGLTDGTYTVSIRNASTDSVDIDGFRVYGTVDVSSEAYKYDLEENPTYVELRNEMLVASGIDKSTDVKAQVDAVLSGEAADVVAISDASKMSTEDAQKMKENGPKNELYVAPNQSVVFTVSTQKEVQLGMHAVNGSVTVAGSYSGTITSSTDMYYEVKATSSTADTKTITITNNGSGYLSIGKVKVSDDPDAALCAVQASDLNSALAEMGLVDEPEVAAPAITEQPTSVTAALNKTVSFSVKAENAASYQWQYTKNGKSWFKSTAASAATDTLSLKASTTVGANQYRCKITGTDGTVIYTDVVKVTVLKSAKITSQPVSVTANAGDKVSFTVKASNAVSYQWYYSKDGGKTWYKSTSTGAATDTLSITAKSSNLNNLYRCKITGEDGKTVTSSSVGMQG